MAKEMSTIDWVTMILVIIGALNWGLAVFDYNLVEALLGAGTVAKVVYGLVGLSGLWMIYKAFI